MTGRKTPRTTRSIIDIFYKKMEDASLAAGKPSTVYVLKNGEETALSIEDVRDGTKMPRDPENIEVGFGDEGLYLSLNLRTGKLNTDNFLADDERKLRQIAKEVYPLIPRKKFVEPQASVTEGRESITEIMTRLEKNDYNIRQSKTTVKRRRPPVKIKKPERIETPKEVKKEPAKKAPKPAHSTYQQDFAVVRERRQHWKGRPSGALLEAYIIEALEYSENGLTYTGIVSDFVNVIGLPRRGKDRGNKKREITEKIDILKAEGVIKLEGNVYKLKNK